MSKRDAITSEAISRVGGVKALADALGILPSAVSQWERVPAERMGIVSALTAIPMQHLRPDLFPPDGESKHDAG